MWWLAVFLVAINVLWAGPAFLGRRTLREGDEAPAFTLPRIDDPGSDVSLGSLRGSAVMLVFWATWCDSCVAEIPTIAQVARKYSGRGLEVVGMNLDPGERAGVLAFLRARDVGYPNVGVDEATSSLYRVDLLPTLYLVDRGGRICRGFTGRVGARRLARAVEACIATGNPGS